MDDGVRVDEGDALGRIRSLHAGDPTCGRLAIDVVDGGAGWCDLDMTIAEVHANALGMGHGGVLFTFADAAMQFACNSYGVDAVATSASIDFVRAAQIGDVVRASARETARTGKAAIYDVEVTNSDGATIAIFRGRTLQVGKPNPAPEETP